MDGIVCYQDSTFYSLDINGNLYINNILSGTVTLLGSTGFIPVEEITLFNNNYYFPTLSGIVLLDVVNPGNSSLIVSFPMYSYVLVGISASVLCNTLVAINLVEDEVVSINLSDGSIAHICSIPDGVRELTTYNEFIPPAVCEIYLDLDCNNSSGAIDSDYNSPVFDCLSDPVPIADEDITILIDAVIAEMTITLFDPLPDDPNEILIMTGGVPGISVSGSNTTLITLSNGGGAKMQDFKDALHLIFYNNSSLLPTEGPRTVQVQFTTASGMTSNTASAFVNVNELALLDVDLGPDQEMCTGQTITLNAGNGEMYIWSTGESSQIISVDASGEYMVTVNDGVFCPGVDTVIIEVIPVIHVALTGDTDICDNEQATLTIQTDSPFPINVTIDADPGSPFVFTGIDGTYSFTDLPFLTTEYTITEVVPDQPGCIEFTDPTQVIEVYPTYVQEQEVNLCDGDSIWLGYYWESEAGVYENLLETVNGCDSIVTTYLTILQAVMIQVQSVTCDSAAAGVYITHLDNPAGCDTVVTTTVTLLPSYTTNIALNTCVWTQVGMVTDTYTTQAGCDSLVITTISYIPPKDTTFLFQSSCDSLALGVSEYIHTGYDGCDSLVLVTISFSLTDTTSISGTSCIPLEIGVFETLLTNAQGCDSLVIMMITQGVPDTTSLFATSCDPASLGVFEELLTSSRGCDSLVITTVTFSAQDSTFISSSTCDPAAAGIFVSTYINQFGCDSIVTETVSLLPSDDAAIQSTTCDPSAAGIFTLILTNQYGCDSIVTEIVTLLPSDATSLAATTCIASEAGIFVTTLVNQFGCDSVITETITLINTDTTILSFNSCDPTQVGNVETIYTGQDGCDSLVIESTSLFPLPGLIVQSGSDYNGYDISCTGVMDGSAIANVNGVSPFTYLWSTDDTDQMITGLSAGAYDVAITDGNGCIENGTVTLTEPDVFMIGFEVSELDCFDQQLGSITVLPSGGVAPCTYSIDGTTFQASSVFTGLYEGIYQVTSLDANDCATSEIISIDVPLMVNVDLGENQSIDIGDTTLLEAIINLPFDSLSAILWTGIDSIGCANCLKQIVAPIITTAYSVSVTSEDGCADRDSLTIFVNTDRKIYIPNIFSPNGDGINDLLMISADESVQEIASFSVFDRWGNLVFGAENKQVDDSSLFWDGRMKGEAMNPGVFTYKVIVVYSDRTSSVMYGDITLIR
jgi:gliding motility-associated-like protein